MLLTKTDYENILKLLTTVEIKGVESAKYVAVLAHKIENRVATWFDAHPTGFAPPAEAPAPGPEQLELPLKE